MSSTNQLSVSWLLQQFQLQPGKPAITNGLRSLFILGVPIGVGIFTGHAAESAIATIAAWFVGMVNVDGVYRQKAIALIAATISVTLVFAIANLASSTLWLAIPITFLVIFIVGLAGVFGSVAASVSLITGIMFVVSLARFSAPGNLSTLLLHSLLCLAGGTWTTFLSLGLWVVRPDRPATAAVAICYKSLSKFMEVAGETVVNPQDIEDWAKQFDQAQDNVTQDLTAARSTWASVWTTQRGASQRGNQLLVLIEDANQIITSVVAQVELLAIASDSLLFSHLQREIAEVMTQLVIAMEMLATAIAKGKNSVPLGDLDRSVEALEHQWQILRNQVVNQNSNLPRDEYLDLVNLRKITTSFSKFAEQMHTDAEIVTDLQQGKRRNPINQDIMLPKQPTTADMIETLRFNLTFDSVMFRHALRLAVVVALAELIAALLQIPRGYWITLTALVALKPNFGGTTQTTIQRVISTIVGSIIGITLIVLIHNQWAIAFSLLLLVFMAMSVRSLSYTVFITLLTPAIILLLNMINADGWQVGLLRIVDSCIGGVLALIGSYLLFPSWERQQLPTQLAKTIRANLAYFQQVIANYLNSPHTTIAALNSLRHQAALENANANAAAQRLFSEPRHVQGEIEPVMTLMIYIRNFYSSVTTLAEHQREFSGQYQFSALPELTDTMIHILENLADALQDRKLPQPLPILNNHLETIHEQTEQLYKARIAEITQDPQTGTPTLQALREQTPVFAELERIVNQIKIIHCAIALLGTS
ncbi:FUSC family protein [Nostoc linckia FACHB-104]|nr:FUSC family protein [Nostoc linckia FACHB-104]